MFFPVVMYGCESWTVKKAEHQRIDAFKLWCWRRLLRVPWTARRSNQSILKEISSGCSLEGMILKLKLQYFGHLMRRVDSLEKTDTGGTGGRWRRGRPRMRRLDGITDSRTWVWVNSRSWWWKGRPACCDSWGRKELDTTEQLNWTERNDIRIEKIIPQMFEIFLRKGKDKVICYKSFHEVRSKKKKQKTKPHNRH